MILNILKSGKVAGAVIKALAGLFLVLGSYAKGRADAVGRQRRRAAERYRRIRKAADSVKRAESVEDAKASLASRGRLRK